MRTNSQVAAAKFDRRLFDLIVSSQDKSNCKEYSSMEREYWKTVLDALIETRAQLRYLQHEDDYVS